MVNDYPISSLTTFFQYWTIKARTAITWGRPNDYFRLNFHRADDHASNLPHHNDQRDQCSVFIVSLLSYVNQWTAVGRMARAGPPRAGARRKTREWQEAHCKQITRTLNKDISFWIRNDQCSLHHPYWSPLNKPWCNVYFVQYIVTYETWYVTNNT